jgi:hypothetical protein
MDRVMSRAWGCVVEGIDGDRRIGSVTAILWQNREESAKDLGRCVRKSVAVMPLGVAGVV